MRIKKTSQYIEGGATLSNEYGTSQSNGYSQEYINGIIESGSNTNGRYIKFSDGTLITAQAVTTGTYDNSTNQSTATGTFPMSFISGEKPVVNATVYTNSNHAFFVDFVSTNTTNTGFELRVKSMYYNSFDSGWRENNGITVWVTAMGRWK